MNNLPESHPSLSGPESCRPWGQRIYRFLISLIIYLALELCLLLLVKWYCYWKSPVIVDYLDWVYFFYFPQKKMLFFYYLVFAGTSWAYFFLADIFYINRDFSLSERR